MGVGDADAAPMRDVSFVLWMRLVPCVGRRGGSIPDALWACLC